MSRSRDFRDGAGSGGWSCAACTPAQTKEEHPNYHNRRVRTRACLASQCMGNQTCVVPRCRDAEHGLTGIHHCMPQENAHATGPRTDGWTTEEAPDWALVCRAVGRVALWGSRLDMSCHPIAGFGMSIVVDTLARLRVPHHHTAARKPPADAASEVGSTTGPQPNHATYWTASHTGLCPTVRPHSCVLQVANTYTAWTAAWTSSTAQEDR